VALDCPPLLPLSFLCLWFAQLIASGADGAAQVAAEEARKASVNAAKKERRDYNKNTRVAKETGLTKPGQKKPVMRGPLQAPAAKGAKVAEQTLAELEAELMPLVKQGDEQVAAGDVSAGLALYVKAMDGFRGAGHKRPKLKQKIDAAKELLIEQQVAKDAAAEAAAAAEPEPAVDESVEVDASVEVQEAGDAGDEDEDEDMDDNEC
jgi:hypothetical protein